MCFLSKIYGFLNPPFKNLWVSRTPGTHANGATVVNGKSKWYKSVTFCIVLLDPQEPASSTTRLRRQTKEAAISQAPLETASEIKVPDADEPENALKNIWPLGYAKKETTVSPPQHSVLFFSIIKNFL